MKVSNETKIGALTAIAITTLILGFNFLKGKSLFAKPKQIYAVFDNINGLPASTAPVMMKGLQIGVTGEAVEKDQVVSRIVVPIKLNKDVKIPANSIALISGSPLGLSAAVIEIKPGDDNSRFLVPGDTITSRVSKDILAEITGQLNPVLAQVENTIRSVDSVIRSVGNIFNPTAQNNLQGIIANVNRTTASLVESGASLQQMLNTQTGALAQSLNNVNAFTSNLVKNNEKVNSMLANLDQTSKTLAGLKLDETMASVNQSVAELNNAIKGFNSSLNSNKGTLGKLLNDPAVYQNLNNLIFSLNTLVDDLKVNPKRYISIFGRKDRTIKPLDRPLNDSVPQ